MFKNRVLQMRVVKPTDPTKEFSEPTIDLKDIAATAVVSVTKIMGEGVKLMVAWVVLDTARQIVINRASK